MNARTTIIDKTDNAARATALAEHHGHTVMLSALACALARHVVVTSSDAVTQAFLDDFVRKARKMGADSGVPAVAAAAERKTDELVALLLAAHRDAISNVDRG
jgi:hypothetical protein